MQCLFDPWITDPGTPTYISMELIDNLFWVKSTSILCQLAYIFYVPVQKENILKLVKFAPPPQKKGKTTKIFPSSFLLLFDSGLGIRDG
jgi:hypothetical protein